MVKVTQSITAGIPHSNRCHTQALAVEADLLDDMFR